MANSSLRVKFFKLFVVILDIIDLRLYNIIGLIFVN